MSEKIRVAGIENDSITDGPGLRLTIFLQGCRKSCPGCHNPAAQRMDGGTLYTTDALMEMIGKNPLLSGVTFSGGEPLLQARGLLPLAKQIKESGLHIAVYTGYTFEEILLEANEDVLELLRLCDTLVDGPFLLEKKLLSLPFRGSQNQRILNISASLGCGRPVLEQDDSWHATDTKE
ncbi:MAG: anaerobic ribonucleoside-triphosphate reductase activating protein [Christensenellaceae bacterium]